MLNLTHGPSSPASSFLTQMPEGSPHAGLLRKPAEPERLPEGGEPKLTRERRPASSTYRGSEAAR